MNVNNNKILNRACLPGALLMFLMLVAVGCSEQVELADTALAEKARTVHKNGAIYTQNSDALWAEALAYDHKGRLLYVGSNAGVEGFVGPDTEVHDLAGRFVMPGIIDAHAHPAWGGVTALFYCLFPATALPAEVQETIRQCVREAPDEDVWIQGGLWAADFFTQYQIDSPAKWLDEVSGDKAIALKDDSGHNYWLNSKGLSLLGLDRESVPPPGGKYPKDKDGELNGVLLETFSIVGEQLPPWTVTHYKAGIEYALNNAAQYGVTGWKDASSSAVEVQAYYELDQDNRLSAHIAACLILDGDYTKFDIAAYNALRDKYASKNVHTGFAKIFLDGIPTMAKTAAMVAPYVTDAEGEAPNYGPVHVAETDLVNSLVEFDAHGYTVKVHTAGDRSVQIALDAIAQVRAKNGNADLAHELAHAGFIGSEDIPRFGELNVVADLSPHLWFPSPIVESVRSALGERGYEYWPNRDLLDAGAPLLVGSDWPSVTPDLNPWLGLEALVTRQDPHGAYVGRGWQAQALTLAEGIKVLTEDGARALGMGD